MTPIEWWPRFHDVAYRPSLREQVIVHWRANLLMLRSPSAITSFMLLSLWPVALLLATWWLLGFLDDNNPFLTRSSTGLATAAATFLGFLLLQHVAFSQALIVSYAPFVRRAIRARGTPVCVHCGHVLGAGTPPAHGLAPAVTAPPIEGSPPGSDRCPECGRPPQG